MLLKSIVLVTVVLLAAVIFLNPFPGTCFDCSIFQKTSAFIFAVLGITAFCLPFFLALTLFHGKWNVNKYLKLWLLLWVPVLINLALVRDILEIKAGIGGIAGTIFILAHEHRIDFFFIFIPILALDLLILFLLGVDVLGFSRPITRELKGLWGNKNNGE